MDEVIAHLATATVRTAYVVLCLAFGGFLGLLGCVGVAMPYIDDSHERLVILVAPASRAPLVARVCVAVCIVVAGSGVIHPESHHPAGTAAKSYHPKYAGRWPTPAQRFSRGPRSGAPALRRVVAAS